MRSKRRTIEERLAHKRARLELLHINSQLAAHKHARERSQKLRENTEAMDWLSGYSDLIDRLRGPDKDFVFPISTANDRRYGANWPFWRTLMEHARLRAASRLICKTSPLAAGSLNAIVSYVVGEGMPIKVMAAVPSAPPPLVKKCQQIIDDFVDMNEFNTLQQEDVERCHRDGESIQRLFGQEDGTTLIRTPEPEHLLEPPNVPYDVGSFGVLTDPEDLLDYKAYWLAYDGNAGNGEEVPADEIVHTKLNVDRTIKRGMPDFTYDTLSSFQTATRLLEGLGQGSAIQANIAFIRQHQVAPSSSVSDFVSANGDYTETNPFTGSQRDVTRVRPGTVIDMDAGQEFVAAPFAANVPGFVQVVQAVLRSAAVRWNAPEWIVSADSSNNNFSSSLVAESAFVKGCKREQKRHASAYRRIAIQVLEHYCKTRGGIQVGGERYPWELVKKLIDVQVTPPSVEVRNKSEEAQTNQTYVTLGIKSRQRVAQELGLEWQDEERNNEEYEKKHGEQGVPDKLRASGQAEAGEDNPLAALLGGGKGKGEKKEQGQEQPERQEQPQEKLEAEDANKALSQMLGESLTEEYAEGDHCGIELLESEEPDCEFTQLLEAAKYGTGVFHDKNQRVYCLQKGKRVPCANLSQDELQMGPVKDHKPAPARAKKTPAAKTGDGAEKKPVKAERPSVDSVASHVKGMGDNITADGLEQLGNMLRSLTVAQIGEFKKHPDIGVKASGKVKEELVQAILDRVQNKLKASKEESKPEKTKKEKPAPKLAPKQEEPTTGTHPVVALASRIGSDNPPTPKEIYPAMASLPKLTTPELRQVASAIGVTGKTRPAMIKGIGEVLYNEKATEKQSPKSTAKKPTPDEIIDAVGKEAVATGRDGMPIHKLRAKLGMDRDEFDSTLKQLRSEGKVRLVAAGDRSRLTTDELRDSIQGENETFVTIEPGEEYWSKVRAEKEKPAEPKQSSSEIEKLITDEFADALGDYAESELVPIHAIRRKITQKLGKDAIGKEAFDAAIQRLGKQGVVRLVPISDYRDATNEQLADSVEGVNETLFYLKPTTKTVANKSKQSRPVHELRNLPVHQRTQGEHRQVIGDLAPSSNGGNWETEVNNGHRWEVENALLKGEKVSPEVLKDYPDLAKPSTTSFGKASEQDREKVISDAAEAISSRDKKIGGIVHVHELVDRVKDAFPDASPAEVHRQLRKMQMQDKLTLQKNTTEWMNPRSKEDIRSPRGLLSYVQMRPKQPAGANPKHAHSILSLVRNSEDNYIPLHVLADKTGMSIPEMHAAVNDLRKKGLVTASALEGRHGITPRERETAIREHGDLLGAISFNEDKQDEVDRILKGAAR